MKNKNYILLAVWLFFLMYGYSLGVCDSYYTNILNLPFNTISSGPQSAIIVDVDDPQDTKGVQKAVDWKLESLFSELRFKIPKKIIQLMIQKGILKPGSKFIYDRIVILRSRGKLVLPDLEKGKQSLGVRQNELTFSYRDWSAGDEQLLRDFVGQVYPIIKSIYGSPAFNIGVEIVREPALGEIDLLHGGVYNPSENKILLPPIPQLPPGSDYYQSFHAYHLTHMIIHAFHDELMLNYDAWEEGFARAAALVCQKIVNPQFDPSDDPVYLLPLYDLLNQRSLGNNTFYPLPGQLLMSEFRCGMALAAWLKVYIENNSFFQQFNAQYYAQAPSNPNLPGDVPGLKAIAASIVPQVEGLAFEQWYKSQYILDTSISYGAKIYVFNLPQVESVVLILYYYRTTMEGNEEPLTGTAYLTYWSWDGYDLFAEEGYEAEIPYSPDVPGLGFISPTFISIGGPQRITVDILISDLFVKIYYPYGVGMTEEEGPLNNFFGALVHDDSGTVDITINGNTFPTLNVSQGVFGANLAGQFNSWNKGTLTCVTGGDTITRQINMGYYYYATLVAAPVTVAQLSHTFERGKNGLHFMALPLEPLKYDPAEVLGLPAAKVLLARWRPDDPNPDFKYHFYPDVPPFRPGLGYWLKVFNDLTVDVEGIAPSPNYDFEIKLLPGWNQIGNPFQALVVVEYIVVKYGIDEFADWQTARDEGLVGPIWGYSQQEGYKMVDTLDTWQGFWIKANQEGLSLMIPPPIKQKLLKQKSVSKLSPPEIGSAQHWQIQLGAQTESGKDLFNFIGVTARSTDAFDGSTDFEEPPSIPGGYVALYFAHPEWGKHAGLYASDFRAPLVNSKAWYFEVRSGSLDEEVTVTWNFAKLPKQYRPILVDLDAERSIYMRTTAAYTYTPGEGGMIRHFKIEVSTNPVAILKITNITGKSMPGGKFDIAYVLSAPASVSATVYNLVGKPIRKIAVASKSDMGINHLVWDSRDALGNPVASGVYICQIVAITEEGQLARAFRTLMVVR